MCDLIQILPVLICGHQRPKVLVHGSQKRQDQEKLDFMEGMKSHTFRLLSYKHKEKSKQEERTEM
jgi:hypothetical protein